MQTRCTHISSIPCAQGSLHQDAGMLPCIAVEPTCLQGRPAWGTESVLVAAVNERLWRLGLPDHANAQSIRRTLTIQWDSTREGARAGCLSSDGCRSEPRCERS